MILAFAVGSGIVLAVDGYCFSQEGLLFQSSKGMYFLRMTGGHSGACEWITFPCLLVCFILVFALALVSPLCEGMVTQALYLVEFEFQTVVDL